MMALLLPKGGMMPLYWSACYWVVLRRVFDLVMRFGTPSPQTYSIVDSLLLPPVIAPGFFQPAEAAGGHWRYHCCGVHQLSSAGIA